MRVAVSWSGGKDGALAARASQASHDVVGLVAVVDPDHRRVRAHGTPAASLAAQADATGRRLELREAGWDGYEAAFRDAAATLRDEAGVEGLVFGDVDLEEHRTWGERVADELGLEALYPLWEWDHRRVVEEAVAEGIEAVVVSVRDPLDEDLLGRPLTVPLAEAAAEAGASPSGEDGAYHTVVRDGPAFPAPLDVVTGAVEERDGYAVLDHELRAGEAPSERGDR